MYVAERYELVRELGRGGMGSVFEARHTWTGRRVALKTLLPHLASDPSAVERFRREARAGVVGAHPNIAEVLDMGVDPSDGTLYLAQEFLDGEDLARRLGRDRVLAPHEALAMLVPAMMALDAAHRAGVIHRDIKPGNLFVARGPDGQTRLKVIDFGIANLADAAPVTRSGAPMGTPQYMAPEQARGEGDLDPRADVWSMGVVCFEVLSGRRPFDGQRYHDVLAQVLTARPPTLYSVAPQLDRALCAVVDGALEAERGRRHASMAAMAAAFAALPAFAAEPWAVAVREARPSLRPAPVSQETRTSPVTLELPSQDDHPGASSDVSIPPPPETLMLVTPPQSPALAVPVRSASGSRRGALVLGVGLGFVSAVGLSWAVTRDRAASARPPTSVASTAPVPAPALAPAPVPVPVQAPTRPAPAVVGTEAPPRPPSPVQAPTLAVAPSLVRPGLSPWARRGPARRAAPMEPTREAPVVNGAPVLEP